MKVDEFDLFSTRGQHLFSSTIAAAMMSEVLSGTRQYWPAHYQQVILRLLVELCMYHRVLGFDYGAELTPLEATGLAG